MTTQGTARIERPGLIKAERKTREATALTGETVAPCHPRIGLSARGGRSGTLVVFSATNTVCSLATSANQTLTDIDTQWTAVDATHTVQGQNDIA